MRDQAISENSVRRTATALGIPLAEGREAAVAPVILGLRAKMGLLRRPEFDDAQPASTYDPRVRS